MVKNAKRRLRKSLQPPSIATSQNLIYLFTDVPPVPPGKGLFKPIGPVGVGITETKRPIIHGLGKLSLEIIVGVCGRRSAVVIGREASQVVVGKVHGLDRVRLPIGCRLGVVPIGDWGSDWRLGVGPS